jgi:hypothetical protein
LFFLRSRIAAAAPRPCTVTAGGVDTIQSR